MSSTVAAAGEATSKFRLFNFFPPQSIKLLAHKQLFSTISTLFLRRRLLNLLTLVKWGWETVDD